jgi:hypothetical protein
MYISPNGKHTVFLGDNGMLLLVDTHTKRLVDTLKMNGTCCLLTRIDEPVSQHATGCMDGSAIGRWLVLVLFKW